LDFCRFDSSRSSGTGSCVPCTAAVLSTCMSHVHHEAATELGTWLFS
jgi:hypothetical protein